jgi:phage-related protein
MTKKLKRLPAKFYRSKSGSEPVREWLSGLDGEDRKIIGTDIKDVEYSWPIGMPLCRLLDNGLWEVRSKITSGRIARVIFYVKGSEMILLHGFVKKTQKTPDHEKKLAQKRKKEHEKHG